MADQGKTTNTSEREKRKAYAKEYYRKHKVAILAQQKAKRLEMEMKELNRQVRNIGNQEFEITQNSNNIFHIPATKQERLNMLKRFIFKISAYRWRNINKKVATMEKELITELIDSIA